MKCFLANYEHSTMLLNKIYFQQMYTGKRYFVLLLQSIAHNPLMFHQICYSHGQTTPITLHAGRLAQLVRVVSDCESVK